MKRDARSVLKLQKLVFDKLLFERKGFSSENNFKFNLESQVSKRSNEDMYRVTLVLHGEKADEYTIDISLTGFFAFESDDSLADEDKKEYLEKSTGMTMSISEEDFIGGLRSVIPGRNILIDHSFKGALEKEYQEYTFKGGGAGV